MKNENNNEKSPKRDCIKNEKKPLMKHMHKNLENLLRHEKKKPKLKLYLFICEKKFVTSEPN